MRCSSYQCRGELNFSGIRWLLITSRDKLTFYDSFWAFQQPPIEFHYFTLKFLTFRIFCFFTCVHLCSLVFTCVLLVFHLCSTCVYLCSLVFTCVLLVFTCVHLCSLVFTCVHLCSLVFYLCSLVFHLCSFVFICVHLCSHLCGVLD